MADRITLILTKAGEDGLGLTIECLPDPDSTWTLAEYAQALQSAFREAVERS